jgi:transposase-like protein
LNQLKDINEVAIAFGKSKTTIRNWLSLLEADPAVHEALRAELISAAAAVEIAIKPRSEQVDLLNQLLPATLGGGEPVSESRARKARQLSEGGHKPQAGVKRTWVRSALTTRQAHNLTDDQRYLLRWFATGAAPADSWISAFEQAVNEELAVKKARSSEPS